MSWLAEKAKIRAVRFYLAQISPETIDVREKFMHIRAFRSEAAQQVYDNPFLYQTEHLYILSKIAKWADVIFKFKWWLYATPELLPEFQRALRRESFRPVGEAEVDRVYYDICLNQARIPFNEWSEKQNKSISKEDELL